MALSSGSINPIMGGSFKAIINTLIKQSLKNMALHIKMSCFFLEIISVFALKMPKTEKSAEILLNLG